MRYLIYCLLGCLFVFWGCGTSTTQRLSRGEIAQLSWEAILDSARGTEVNWMMWQGDPEINTFVSEYVVPEVQQRYGITLTISNGQGNQIISALMPELEAGKEESEIDMMWFNGETFYQLRQINALFGPFTDFLPNSQYIDFENPFIKYDFQQEVDGMECPWGTVQQTLIYDTARVSQPPQNLAELETWVKAHPERFTLPNDFTGMSLLKSMLIEFYGGKEAIVGEFNEEKYQKHSAELWAYINRIKPYFWKKGETFPSGRAAVDQMFASGELDFSMSMNDAEVESKVLQEVFVESSTAYVWDIGTIRNSHYQGIPIHARNPLGALVVINFLISPEAQLKKTDPKTWGDGTILAVDKLPAVWQEKFKQIPPRTYAPQREEIEPNGLPEPAPEYMIRIFEDFRKEVIQQ
ncbi:MAG: ABC transporter substrate-binding protein [Bacteroidota bacterium]